MGEGIRKKSHVLNISHSASGFQHRQVLMGFSNPLYGTTAAICSSRDVQSPQPKEDLPLPVERKIIPTPQ